MKKLVFLMVVQSLLSGCGLILIGNALDKSERTYDDKTTAEKSFSQSTVKCSGSDCPSFVGGLYTISDSRLKVGACSMTLISPDRVLTNAHCIPDDISYKGAGCRGRILVNFPKTASYNAERFDCHSIEQMVTNTHKVDEPDWAIIKLMHPSTRPYAALDFRGVPDHSDLTLYKINFDLYISTPSVGHVKKTQCKGNTNHMFSDKSVGPKSALINLSHCDVKMISGNSGSGYFSSATKKLVGIHSWGLHVEDSEDDWARRMKAQYPHMKQNVGGGTNLACIPAMSGYNPPAECIYDTYKYFRLAKAYAELRQETANSQFWEELATQTFSRNQGRANFVEFSEEVETVSHRFEVEFEGDFAPLKKVVFEKLVETRFPNLPKCFNDQQVENFELSFIDSRGDSEVDQYTFYKTQGMQTEDMELEVSKMSASMYKMSFQASKFASDVRGALDWSIFDTIDLTVPKCN